MLLPQVFNCNWHNFHWDCIIQSTVLPPCALFMKWPTYLKGRKESHDKPQQILPFPFPSEYSAFTSSQCKYSAITFLQLLCIIIILGVTCCYLIEVTALQEHYTTKRQSPWKRLAFPQTKLSKFRVCGSVHLQALKTKLSKFRVCGSVHLQSLKTKLSKFRVCGSVHLQSLKTPN